jgi:hypothetical protein
MIYTNKRDFDMPTRTPIRRAPAPTPAKQPAPKRPRAAAVAPTRPAAKLAKEVVPVLASAPIEAKVAKTKAKLVRDSFTMPRADFDLIAALKQRALGFQRPTKKSELLRAGLHALLDLDEARLRSALEALVSLKPGRPKKPS